MSVLSHAFARRDVAPGLRGGAAGLREAAKLAVGAVTLVPLRLALIVAVLSFLVAAGRLAMVALPRRRQAPVLTALVAGVSRALLLLLGFVRIDELPPPGGLPGPREAPVVVSNHVSWVEILYFLSNRRLCPAFVLKPKVLAVPFIGTVASRFLRCVAVGRAGSTTGALAERVEAVAAGREPRRLLVFPEGTTSNGAVLLRFRSGAFVPGRPVLPVCVQFTYRTFSPSWEAIYPSVHLLRMLSQPTNRMRVAFMDVYRPSPAERADAALFAANVRAAMAARLRLPMVDAGYAEKMLYHDALRRAFARSRFGWVANLWTPNALESDISAVLSSAGGSGGSAGGGGAGEGESGDGRARRRARPRD